MPYSDQSYNLRIELDTKHCSCSPEEIERMNRALAPLERLAEPFPISDLYVTVIHHPRSGDFHVKTALILSDRVLFTGERNRDMYAAYTQCIGKLVRKLSAYKSRLSADRDHSKHVKGTEHDIVPTDVPDHDAIEQAVTEGDFGAFRDATAVYEEPVRKRIGRWIQRYPAIDGSIGLGLEISDLVEGVFLHAFDRFNERPSAMLPGEWMEGLIDEEIRDIVDHPDEELENISMVRSAREAEHEHNDP